MTPKKLRNSPKTNNDQQLATKLCSKLGSSHPLQWLFSNLRLSQGLFPAMRLARAQRKAHYPLQCITVLRISSGRLELLVLPFTVLLVLPFGSAQSGLFDFQQLSLHIFASRSRRFRTLCCISCLDRSQLFWHHGRFFVHIIRLSRLSVED